MSNVKARIFNIVNGRGDAPVPELKPVADDEVVVKADVAAVFADYAQGGVVPEGRSYLVGEKGTDCQFSIRLPMFHVVGDMPDGCVLDLDLTEEPPYEYVRPADKPFVRFRTSAFDNGGIVPREWAGDLVRPFWQTPQLPRIVLHG